MVSLNFTTNYDQKKPNLDAKKTDKEKIEVQIDHAHPHKLEDFFKKNKKHKNDIWELDQSTLDKVQKLIKDITYYNDISSYSDISLEEFEISENIPKKLKKQFEENNQELQVKIKHVLKKDITLLYNIYSYTHAAFSVPECKNKPLAKTISDLAFATLNRLMSDSSKEIKQYVKSFNNVDDNSTEKPAKPAMGIFNAIGKALGGYDTDESE